MERQADAQHLRLLVERSQKLRAFGDDLGEVWREARGPMNPERYQRLRSMIEKLLARVRG